MPLATSPIRYQVWNQHARGYLIALMNTMAAIWVRSLLTPAVKDECPFSLFFLSVLITAWLAGTGPAIFAWMLGVLAAAHFFIPPESSLWIEETPDIISLAIYAIVNLIAIVLFHLVGRERSLAEQRTREIENLNDHLRRSDQRKDEFLALLAHELRNPLAPIRSSLTLLVRSPRSPSIVDEVRDVLNRQVAQLVRIVDDLFDIARFMRGKIALRSETLDLRDSVNMAVEMTQDAFKEKSQSFRLLLPRSPVFVEGDSVRLTQLMANILCNAGKFTPKDGRISLELETDGSDATIVVADTGIGFPLSEACRILEPFTQTDTSRTRDYGGLGVGLTIAKKLAELHGGTLEPFSRGPGTGSRFTIKLPLAVSHTMIERPGDDTNANVMSNAQNVAQASQEGATCSTAVATSLRVLVVDDNTDTSRCLVSLLRMESISVESAIDGYSALQLAEQFLPDVILLDLGLPGIDGYEVAKRLRIRPELARTKIIALTGWGSENDRNLSKQAGFDEHLVKPVDFEQLMRHLLPKSSAARELAESS